MSSGGKQSKEEDEWKKYQTDFESRLLLNRVRYYTGKGDAAHKRRDIKEYTDCLEEALEECEQHEDLQKEKIFKTGKVKLEVIKQRKVLRSAVEAKKFRKAEQEIRKIKDTGGQLFKELQQDVIWATTQLPPKDDRLAYLQKKRNTVYPLDRITLLEMRRYHNPPLMIHRIIQAALLLRGQGELITNDWSKCCKMLGTNGCFGTNKGFMEFDPSKIEPSIMARAKYILTKEQYDFMDKKHPKLVEKLQKNPSYKPDKEYQKKHWRTIDLRAVQSANPSAAAFYIWAMMIVDEHGSKDDDQNSSQPASPRKQQEILVKQPEKPPQRYLLKETKSAYEQ